MILLLEIIHALNRDVQDKSVNCIAGYIILNYFSSILFSFFAQG